MLCARCQTPNPDGAAACSVCQESLAEPGDPPAPSEAGLTSSPTVTPALRPSGVSHPSFSGPASLPEGFEIGRRYRVVKLLGRGGMGAVYRCHDEELQREVALKIIRPEIASDTAIIERFKREIQLSSRVTNKNVLRVYDLGEAEGVRFLTMQFVEGEDLASLLRHTGPLPLTRLVHVFRQICEGLAAAHEEGVVHRDLKPQNILLDAEDHVWLTDFGLAKSLGGSAMTEMGALMGTPSYMSPEQVRGQAVDNRSDIYSLGIVFYEMATGRTPFAGGTMYEVMMRRLTTPPRPVTELNPAVPPYLRKILERCLEVDPRSRFQSVGEILTDLDAAAFQTTVRYELHRRRRLFAALGFALAVGLGVWGISRLATRAPAPSRAPKQARSILIADFENKTGDSVFDGTLENALGVALEDASFITTFSRGTARKEAAELRPGTGGLSEAAARLVAAREGVGTVIAGAVEGGGNGYRVSVTAEDARTGKSIVSVETTAEGKKDVLGAVAKLASRVRGGLGDTEPESERLAAAETFTTGSLEASHEYAVAQDFQWAGRFDEAVAHYQKAVDLDPEMGRAYAGLGAIYFNRGRHADAKKWLEDAMRRLERMSEREKFRTRGLYYLVTRRPDKAAEEFSALVKQYPADTAGIANLALALFYAHDLPLALRQGRRAIDIYPKNVIQRNNLGLYAMYAGDFETAVKEQRVVLEMNPKFHLAFVGIALSQLAMGKSDDARATWQNVAGIDAHGASLAAMGLADMALAAGKPAEAVSLLEKGAADDLAAKDPEAAAPKLVALAEAQLALGKQKDALASAEKAVSLATGENILFPAAGIFLATGKPQRALAFAADLSKTLENDPRVYGKLIEAEAQLRAGKRADAIRTIEAAKEIADTWMGRFLDGRAYVEAGAYAEAEAELEKCMKRRGEATAVFLDEVPSWRLFGPVLYWRGRAQEGLKSTGAAESYKAFIALRPGAGGNPLVADARRRLGTK